MSPFAADSYLETQIFTATPQRLRLMLIEEALRRIHSAQSAWEAGRLDDGAAALSYSREIIAELIGGIHPDETAVAKQVLGIYLYLLSSLAEAEFSRDKQRLVEIVRVLEEERQTWQAVCLQMPERPATARASASAEEVAPQRVPHAQRGGYEQPAGVIRPHAAVAAFSIDA
jgi:flagellar secretion chaperone FliS